MVANAGVCPTASVLDCPFSSLNPLDLTFIFTDTVEQWDRAFAINTRGVFLCYQYAARQMIKQGRGGRIIGCSSSLGKHGAILYHTLVV